MVANNTFKLKLQNEEIGSFIDLMLLVKDKFNSKEIGFKKPVNPETMELYTQIMQSIGEEI